MRQTKHFSIFVFVGTGFPEHILRRALMLSALGFVLAIGLHVYSYLFPHTPSAYAHTPIAFGHAQQALPGGVEATPP